MMTPQTTEDGEIWPKDTSTLTAKTAIPAQRVTPAHPQIGMDTGEPKNAQPADEKATTQEVVEPKGTMSSGAPSATETTIVTTPAD